MFLEASESSFWRAIDLGATEHVRACVDAGVAGGDASDDEDVSALHHAIDAWVRGSPTERCAAVVRVLVAAGGDPFAKLRREWCDPDGDGDDTIAPKGATPASMVLEVLAQLRGTGACTFGDEQRDAAHAEAMLDALGTSEAKAAEQSKPKGKRKPKPQRGS